jgi:ketosteroid isomerase-like protein
LRSYGTGRVGDVMIADFLRLRDGLVVEFTEIVDSLAIAKLEEC